MDNKILGQAFQYLLDSLLYQQTGNELFDEIVYWTSFGCEILAAIGVLILILRNEPVRKRLRTQDRLIFWECMMVFALNLLQLSLVPLAYAEGKWADVAFFIAWAVNEVLYLLIVLQWLVCVDYCLYFSSDHVKRHYRKAVIPIVVIAVMDILQSLVYYAGIYKLFDNIKLLDAGQTALHLSKLFIEAGYIATAIYIVKRYSGQRREPHFLRLEAFIIPFVFGALFRFYDASFAGYGIILTYIAIKRRDNYIDFKSGLYNTRYLDYLCDHWDKKGFSDGSALLISSEGHGHALAGILTDIKVPDAFIINMGDGKFLMIAGFLRKSAFMMAEQMVIDGAAEADTPFEPRTKQMRRNKGESMKEFGARIKENCRNM